VEQQQQQQAENRAQVFVGVLLLAWANKTLTSTDTSN